jgi:hypothetical protein
MLTRITSQVSRVSMHAGRETLLERQAEVFRDSVRMSEAPLSCRAVALACVCCLALTAAPAGADVPFAERTLDNAVEVQNQEAFPGWRVVVFPSAPPSGRPAAWPALVETGFHTQIDRNVLGPPRLWLLPDAALPALEAAARENDNELDGPVAKLLHDRGVECLALDLVWTETLPLVMSTRRLSRFRLEAAGEGSCRMRKVGEDMISDDFQRGPHWAAFSPRKKPADAGHAGPASAVVSAPPVAPAASASAAPPTLAGSAASGPAPPAQGEPPGPHRACGCWVAGGSGDGPAGLLALLALLTSTARRRSPARRPLGLRQRAGSGADDRAE